jgi:DNA-binding NarL/FixJ family response regulator
MSWIIRQLLENNKLIKERGDIDSDEYNDLIVIEKKFADLNKKGLFSPVEIKVYNYIIDGINYKDLSSKLNLNRITVSKIYSDIINKLSISLGYEFTDEGYMDYITKKYKLNEEQQKRMAEYIGLDKDKQC